MADMKHMEHLDAVASSDVVVLRRKEATYQGSWKEAGGRSAWFMFRRNMDRLIKMMAPPPNAENASDQFHQMVFSLDQNGHLMLSNENDKKTIKTVHGSLLAENIFETIKANPSGADGTALACLRDLRRYALLIEAELVARGVVMPEHDNSEAKGEAWRQMKGAIASGPMTIGVDHGEGDFTIFSEMLHDFLTNTARGTRREDLRIGRPYEEGGLHYFKLSALMNFLDLQGFMRDRTWVHHCIIRKMGGGEKQFNLGPDGSVRVFWVPAVDYSENKTDWKMSPYGKTNDELQDRVVPRFAEPLPPGTPDDGGQHASRSPWALNAMQRRSFFSPQPGRDRDVEHVLEAWWEQRAPDVWVLRPAVARGPGMPIELATLYVMIDNYLYLDLAQCPEDVRDYYSDMRMELNHHELMLLPEEYRPLYTPQDQTLDKYLLRLHSWHRTEG